MTPLYKEAQLPKIKKPKATKTRKPSKQPKGGKNSNAIEVKVSLPITKVSVMTLFLAGLLTLMGYAGYLGVNSIWKFTHPQFNVSLDALKSIGYIANKASMPAFPKPAFNNPGDPDSTEQGNYMKAISEFKTEFRTQFPGSQLLNISDNELFNIGSAFCTAKDEAKAKSGEFSREEIVKAFQAKFVLRYPRVKGLDIYLDGVGQAAFDHLCGGP
jgi:hypothetical protein